MNKLLQKVAKLFLGISMAAGVGVAVGAGRKDASPARATETEYSFQTSVDSHWTASSGRTSGSENTGRGSAWTSNVTLTLTNTSTVTSVAIVISTNNTGNSCAVSVGGNSYGSQSLAKENYATKTFTGSKSGNVVVSLTRTAKTIWIQTITVTTSSGGGGTKYTVTYNANNATGGSVPTDATAYSSGGTVTVKGNTGNLVRTGYTWSGWSLNQDGSGTAYGPSPYTTTYTVQTSNINFYAIWVEQSASNKVTISYNDIPDGFTATTGTSGNFHKTFKTANDLTIVYAGINTKSSDSAADHAYGYAMFLKNYGYIYNSTAPSGYYPSKVTATFGSGTGTSGYAGISFGTAALTSRDSSVSGEVSKSGTCALTNSDPTKLYWNFSTTGANVQVDNVEIEFTQISTTDVLQSINLAASALGTTDITEATLKTNKTLQVYLTGNYSESGAVNVTNSATWTATPGTGSATVQNGLITPGSVGTVTITGTFGGKSKSLSLTVAQGPTLTTTPLNYTNVYVNKTYSSRIDVLAANFATENPTISVESADTSKVVASINSSNNKLVDITTTANITENVNVNVTVSVTDGVDTLTHTVEIRVKVPTFTLSSNSVSLNLTDEPTELTISGVDGLENGYTGEISNTNTSAYSAVLANDYSSVTITPLASGTGTVSVTLKNGTTRSVTKDISVSIVDKPVISGHKYFVVSTNNEILLAKGLDGSLTGSNSANFYSTAVLTQDGKYVAGIDGVSANSLEDYAWTITEADTDKYTLKNSNTTASYFNIWYQTGSFYIDGSVENFTFTQYNDSHTFSIYGNHSTTYLNTSNGSFVTDGKSATTYFKFIEYKEFGTLDHIEVNEQASKTVYYLNDVFSLSDVFLTAYDTNGIPAHITDGFTCSGQDTTIVGIQTVTVTYSGKTDTYSIEVIKWRNVIVSSNDSCTYDFSTITESGTTAISSISEYHSGTQVEGDTTVTNFYPKVGYMQVAASSKVGSLTIEFDEGTKITSVTVVAMRWDSDETAYTLMGKSVSGLTDSETTTTYSVANGDYSETNTFTLNCASGKRIKVVSILIQTHANTDIGKETDCLNLEKFIDTYLRSNLPYDPDPTLPVNNTTECKSLYPAARKAFNNEEGAGAYALNDHQRELFSTNDAYANERARLQAWALANQDVLNLSTHLLVDVNSSPLLFALNADNRNTVAIIVIISMVSVTAIGGYFFLRKRKEQ